VRIGQGYAFLAIEEEGCAGFVGKTGVTVFDQEPDVCCKKA
jgi:hypothetical protein